MKTYKFPITELKPNQVFVFGSNTQGRHGMGAALWARLHAGAIPGRSQGFQGASYAIVTKNLTVANQPSVKKEDIIEQIKILYKIATEQDYKEFFIAYRNSENLNGYRPIEMASMFVKAGKIPNNIIFEESFYELINYLLEDKQ